MEFLRLLEGIRNPLCDTFFGSITYLGDETVFLILCLSIFWCVSKQEGYYLLTAGLGGTVFNQFLKIFCRIPRPWVLDENFTIVESARERATGYSFPSGHSQNAVGTYGGIALWTGKRAVRVVTVIIAVVICFSRLYLGVHTPKDVLVGGLSALVLLLILRPLMKKGDSRINRMVLLILTVMALCYLIFMYTASFPAETDPANLAEAMKNAHVLFSCSMGFLIIHELDMRYIHFETKAVWYVQIIKVAVGFALVMGIRMALKPVLGMMPISVYWADAIRYFAMVLFAGGVWPMDFRRLNRIGQPR